MVLHCCKTNYILIFFYICKYGKKMEQRYESSGFSFSFLSSSLFCVCMCESKIQTGRILCFTFALVLTDLLFNRCVRKCILLRCKHTISFITHTQKHPEICKLLRKIIILCPTTHEFFFWNHVISQKIIWVCKYRQLMEKLKIRWT